VPNRFQSPQLAIAFGYLKTAIDLMRTWTVDNNRREAQETQTELDIARTAITRATQLLYEHITLSRITQETAPCPKNTLPMSFSMPLIERRFFN